MANNHPRAYLGDNRMLTRTRFGQLIFVDTRDVSISPHIIMSGDWESWVTNALCENHLWSGQGFVDVGANCGWYSLLAASRGMQVFSFEPNERLCTLMRQTAAVNGYLDRWEIYQTALSANSDELVRLEFTLDNQGGASLKDEGPCLSWRGKKCIGEHQLQTACLDDKIPPGTKISTIKIDVEGYEHKVLLGAQRVLAENRELTLAVEHHHGDLGMIEWLMGLGFDLGHFDHCGLVIPCSPVRATALPDAEMLCFTRGQARSDRDAGLRDSAGYPARP